MCDGYGRKQLRLSTQSMIFSPSNRHGLVDSDLDLEEDILHNKERSGSDWLCDVGIFRDDCINDHRVFPRSSTLLTPPQWHRSELTRSLRQLHLGL